MASISVSPSYTTCKFTVSSLSASQTEADFFVIGSSGLVDSEYGVQASSSKITGTASGLSENTTYDYEVDLDDGTVFEGSFKTSKHTEAYRVYVTTYLDGTEYDSANRNYTVQTQTVSTWLSSVGTSVPSGTFSSGSYTRGSTSGSCTLSTSLKNSNTLYIDLYYVSRTPVTPTNVSISPSTVTVGGSATMSGSYTGDLDSTGSWVLYYTTVPSYTNPTLIASINQNTRTYSTTGSTEGTYYVWVRYYGGTHGTENYGGGASITVSLTPPVTVDSITIPDTIAVGQSFTTSGTYSGTKDSSGSWQIDYTTSSTRSNPSIIAKDISQSASSKSGCVINEVGTFYVWVWYYGATQGSRVSIYKEITVTEQPVSNAYIYCDGEGKNAIPYIGNGSSGVQATPNIYDGGGKS